LVGDHLPVIIKLSEPEKTEEIHSGYIAERTGTNTGLHAACRSLLTSDMIDDDVVASRDRVVTGQGCRV